MKHLWKNLNVVQSLPSEGSKGYHYQEVRTCSMLAQLLKNLKYEISLFNPTPYITNELKFVAAHHNGQLRQLKVPAP